MLSIARQYAPHSKAICSALLGNSTTRVCIIKALLPGKLGSLAEREVSLDCKLLRRKVHFSHKNCHKQSLVGQCSGGTNTPTLSCTSSSFLFFFHSFFLLPCPSSASLPLPIHPFLFVVQVRADASHNSHPSAPVTSPTQFTPELPPIPLPYIPPAYGII